MAVGIRIEAFVHRHYIMVDEYLLCNFVSNIVVGYQVNVTAPAVCNLSPRLNPLLRQLSLWWNRWRIPHCMGEERTMRIVYWLHQISRSERKMKPETKNWIEWKMNVCKSGILSYLYQRPRSLSEAESTIKTSNNSTKKMGWFMALAELRIARTQPLPSSTK